MDISWSLQPWISQSTEDFSLIHHSTAFAAVSCCSEFSPCRYWRRRRRRSRGKADTFWDRVDVGQFETAQRWLGGWLVGKIHLMVEEDILLVQSRHVVSWFPHLHRIGHLYPSYLSFAPNYHPGFYLLFVTHHTPLLDAPFECRQTRAPQSLFPLQSSSWLLTSQCMTVKRPFERDYREVRTCLLLSHLLPTE